MEASIIDLSEIESFEIIENETVYDLTVENNHNFYLATNSGKPILVHNSGKTELLLELLFNTSEFYGWKHLLYVPDIGDSIEVMCALIHKYTGKTFDKQYKNFIEIKEAYKACDWLLQHFFILEKTEPKALITPVQFWEFAIEFKKEHSIQTATIDSWKDLHHPYSDYGGNYAMYLSNILPIRNMLSEQHNIHFHTIIHPKTPRRDKNGKLHHPQTDDMEGGAQWNNSGKSIISVHRESYDNTIADVQILKAKPKIVGKRGMLSLNFDIALSRYYETYPSGHKMYAHRETKIDINEKRNTEFLSGFAQHDNPPF